MTQWLLEEALLERLHALKTLEQLREVEARRLADDVARAREDARAALHGGA